MLNNDGKFLEFDEKYNMKYSDVADKNITERMEFWGGGGFANANDCGAVCMFKALVRIALQNF